MLSATPADNWSDMIPLLVAHGFYRNRTEFSERHIIWSFNGRYRKIRGYYDVRTLERLRARNIVEMPFERVTIRHLVERKILFDAEAFRSVWIRRWNVFSGTPIVDVAEKYRVGRRVVNSDPSRLQEIVELGKTHPRMIIYYNFDYELELLRTLMPKMDIPMAEWNGHFHEEIPETERWIYLCQYQAASDAWNCTTTNCIVDYVDLYYYILMSDSQIDRLIWKALVQKRNFHEARNVKFDPIISMSDMSHLSKE
jgi:hypothetical protein